MAKSKKGQSKKSKATKSRTKNATPSAVEQDLAASLTALRKACVAKALLIYKERAINSVIRLNDRIKAEAGKATKTAEREAKKAERKKAKADREAKAVERKKARATALKDKIVKLQAQVKKLD